MTKAFGYTSKGRGKGAFKPQFHQKQKKKERDPDAMNMDFTQMSQEEKEDLMKLGRCFKCRKQGHLSKNCPQKQKVDTHEATIQTPPRQIKKAEKKKNDPPSYNSRLKQINACSIKDRQKLMEVFSNTGSEDKQDF
jgi:hypothetical protein